VDIAHGVARYLELVKLIALVERPAGQDLAEALQDVNSRLLTAVTPMQREILESSTLDERLLGGDGAGELAGLMVGVSPEERSLEPFLPRRGGGLSLSASDVETYRSCPLRYKYARVLKIPTTPTVGQRFGIVVHQALERYHATGATTESELQELFAACWRRSGLGGSQSEEELLEKAREALRRYHERLLEEPGEPAWFERPFTFTLGPHRVRGRVDRVDRLPGAGYELIDYKTSRAKTEGELEGDIQLSLYALAARESWGIEATSLAYMYVLDAKKVNVPTQEANLARVTELVAQAAAAITAERFDPTPSQAACAVCDYRIVCPAAER
jgi:DNA helicase-2/ATP-dependent DNA helicase PcrA